MRELTHRVLLTAPSLSLPRAGQNPILMLSMRRVSALVGSCALYEGEDLIAELLGADMAQITNTQGLHLGRRIYKLARYATGSAELAESVRPEFGAVPLDASYDVFLPFFNHPHELFALHGLRNWRERCRFAACYIDEAWDADLPRYLIELLRRFDHIFVGVKGSIQAIGKICDRPCSYLPMGIDALRFCPHPDPPQRSIDVASVGRRSDVTHDALLELAAKRKNFFYHHDTVRTGGTTPISFWVTDPKEHRLLLANILKRTRYFIANRAWADRPSFTRGKEEVPARFYEGAAAGAVMLGEPPETADFQAQFGWPDAVVRAPFHAPQIADLIAELDADPARTTRVRTDNVINALLRHDWSYRVREILAITKLATPPQLTAREQHLRELALLVRRAADSAAGSGVREQAVR